MAVVAETHTRDQATRAEPEAEDTSLSTFFVGVLCDALASDRATRAARFAAIPTPTELANTVLLTGWAVLFLLPQLDIYSKATTFNALATVAPEWVWGVTACALLLLTLAGLLVRAMPLRMAGMTACALWWGATAVAFFGANHASLGAWANAGYCAACLWGFFRMRLVDYVAARRER